MDWLLHHAPGFSELDEEERQALGEFALLWSLFESRVMNEAATGPRIYAVVNQWDAEGSLNAPLYEAEIGYFRNRYFDGTNFTHHFDHLHLRPNNNPNLVKAVIDGSNDNPSDLISAIHTIVFRFRNNLFHGIKWQYQLKGQLMNFRTASAVLMKSLERHGSLGD